MIKLTIEIGNVVALTDEVGQDHLALVTAVWGDGSDASSLNVVFVSKDESATDPYGRQVDRRTSILHHSRQPAPGMFWTELKQ